MPPKKIILHTPKSKAEAQAAKANALFIPSKTIPKRDGQTTVGARPRQCTEFDDMGGVDREKLAQLDLEREKKGLPSLKKTENTNSIEEEEAKAAKVDKAKAAKEAKELRRAAALAKGKPQPPPRPTAAEEADIDAEIEMEIREEQRQYAAMEKAKGPPPAHWLSLNPKDHQISAMTPAPSLNEDLHMSEAPAAQQILVKLAAKTVAFLPENDIAVAEASADKVVSVKPVIQHLGASVLEVDLDVDDDYLNMEIPVPWLAVGGKKKKSASAEKKTETTAKAPKASVPEFTITPPPAPPAKAPASRFIFVPHNGKAPPKARPLDFVYFPSSTAPVNVASACGPISNNVFAAANAVPLAGLFHANDSTGPAQVLPTSGLATNSVAAAAAAVPLASLFAQKPVVQSLSNFPKGESTSVASELKKLTKSNNATNTTSPPTYFNPPQNVPAAVAIAPKSAASSSSFAALPPLPPSPPPRPSIMGFSTPFSRPAPPLSPPPLSTPVAPKFTHTPVLQAALPLSPPSSCPTPPSVAVPIQHTSSPASFFPPLSAQCVILPMPAQQPLLQPASSSDASPTNDGDGKDSLDLMDFVLGGCCLYREDTVHHTNHWNWYEREMMVSCPWFAQKPVTCDSSLPWGLLPVAERKLEWELDEYMTEDNDPDAPFDVERYIIETYQTNMEYTARCKFEHTGANSQTNANPFAPLQNGSNSNKTRSTANDFYLSNDSIRSDLGSERPQWVLSAYGPGKEAPEQLWGGQIEQSPEEMRLHAMTSEAAGNLQGALNDFQMLQNEALSKIETAYRNPDAAINYVMQALNQRPNRLDLATNNMNGEFAVGKRPVGFGTGPAFAAPNPFGQPSAPAQASNPFSGGTPGFGQPSAAGPAPGAFGQPSLAGPAPSAFGQPSMGASTGFGQASALGQKPNPFGVQSTQGTGFGQASSLGQKPNPFSAPSALAQPSQPAQSSPFGQPSQLGAKPNPFGAPSSGAGSSASPFGAFANNNTSGAAAPSPFAAPAPINNAFGQNGQTSSPFGQPASNEVSMGSAPTPTANAFSTAGSNAAQANNPFGQPAQAASKPFGQPPQPAATNPFGQHVQQPANGPFGQPTQQSLGNPLNPASASAPSSQQQQGSQQPPYASYATKNPATNLLQTWKGRPVTYQEMDGKSTPCYANADGSFSKIWFPDGPPPFYKDTEPAREYTEAEKSLWAQFAQSGKFQLAASGGGGMPLAAPMRDATRWDF